jgi:hypothetical protein
MNASMLRGPAFASSSRVAAVRPASSSRAATVVVRAVQDLKGKVRGTGLDSAPRVAPVAAAVIPALVVIWAWHSVLEHTLSSGLVQNL